MLTEEGLIDFENLDEKTQRIARGDPFRLLVDKFRSSKKIYLIGNGGLHFSAAHAATDCSRLIPDKVISSFDTPGYITSNANDHGYESLFIRWFECSILEDEYSDSMIIGMSCSGNSKNITRGLAWAHSKGIKTFMISGQKSKRLSADLDELDLNCKYFHTTEVLCLVLFYQLIAEMGYECPSIAKEIERKDPWLTQ